jgi:hypothetical protein
MDVGGEDGQHLDLYGMVAQALWRTANIDVLLYCSTTLPKDKRQKTSTTNNNIQGIPQTTHICCLYQYCVNPLPTRVKGYPLTLLSPAEFNPVVISFNVFFF